jgi:hypothetical protein
LECDAVKPFRRFDSFSSGFLTVLQKASPATHAFGINPLPCFRITEANCHESQLQLWLENCLFNALFLLSPGYSGQSFTTVTVTPESNIAFNFFSDLPATTPYALGTGFLLSMEYLGTPADLSSATPGFLGQATASGGFYTFDPSLTLLPATQYFFYENALIPGSSIIGGNVIAGGQQYLTVSANSDFAGIELSSNFRGYRLASRSP